MASEHLLLPCYTRVLGVLDPEENKRNTPCFIKVYMTQIFFIALFQRALKMMKSDIYFIVTVLLVAELFKILIYTNYKTCDATRWKMM